MNQSHIDDTTDILRDAAERMGADVSPDGRVSERTASYLLGYEQTSFKNLRLAGGGPAFYKRFFDGTSTSYRLCDLSAWLEKSREESL